ncbi:MAG: hypothetical protein ACRD1R_02415 [Acidobacteriota bacterium]
MRIFRLLIDFHVFLFGTIAHNARYALRLSKLVNAKPRSLQPRDYVIQDQIFCASAAVQR